MFLKPDYNGGGIVNLMASIADRFGHRTGYPLLNALPAGELRQYRNVVLIVLDGLGYEYLITQGDGSFLRRHLRSSMTSVFPTTTASCVTTFATGVAPDRHGITGWFTHLPELGAVSKILFAQPRLGRLKFSDAKIDFKKIMLARPLFSQLKTKSFVVTMQSISCGDFSRATSGGSCVMQYRSLNGFFNCIQRALRTGHLASFVSAYWPEIDQLCHHYGIGHPRIGRHFRDLDRRLARLAYRVRGTGTIFLITADHGLVDTPPERAVDLKDHPKLSECLILPLCGEPRLAYCYVRPDKVRQFKSYVKTKLGHCCDLRSRAQLIRQGYFGTGRADSRFAPRVGDFILVMKPGWCIKDFLMNEDGVFLKANHGGVTAAEMHVPLIVVTP